MTPALTLNERARRLSKRVERRRSLDAELQELAAFQARQQQVVDALEALEPIATAHRVLRSLGCPGVPPSGFGELRRKLDTIRARYVENRASVLEQAMFAPVRLEIPRTAKTLLPSLQAQWRAHAEGRIPAIPDDVLNVLAQIPALFAAVTRIRNGLRELRELREVLPQHERDVEKFDGLVGAVRDDWAGLDASQLPPEVLRFLKEAGGEGALLDSMTPTVRSWLERHNLISAFRIRPASARYPA